MKSKFVKIVFVVAIAIVAGVNVFNAHKPIELSDIAMANVEALAEWETGDGICIEWVDKDCYFEHQFSETHGPNYYATCAGESSTPGGKRECGAVESRQPFSPYSPNQCLQCVRTGSEGWG